MATKKEFEHLLKKYKAYAKNQGFRLNPNPEVIKYLINALLEREKKYGKKYCPCRRLKESQKENDKIVCPCIYHHEEIKTNGHCHCFLFVNNEKDMSKFKIDKSKCVGCGACAKLCPYGAIKIENDGKAHIDQNKCKGCGKCKKICPFDAIIETN